MNSVVSRRTMVVIGLGVSVWAVCAGVVEADPLSFKVPLSGGQEVPPVFPSGAGMVDLTYDPASRVVTWSVTYSALSSPVTTVEFHGPAQPSKTAPAALSVVKQGSPADSPISGQATLTPDQARQFSQGEWYVNIATQNHPDGEIRGQVLTPLPAHAEEAHPRHRSRRSKH